ncbi:hypothetical protein MTBLM1_50042 [Rhodospirillaceae bacterium LM-1]|nr:hypothetical protein MTBLM1_50042 [Rhodospirillaceae bacterium LM-1]
MRGNIRHARIEDGLEASAFLEGLGLVQPQGEAARTAHWKRIWIDNPALGQGGEKLPLGVVLEDEAGRIQGFFGNVARIYRLKDRRLIAGCATQWGVAKDWRTETRRLAKAYCDQPGADLLLVTTAKRAASRLFVENDYVAVPQPHLDKVLYWITDANGFLASAFKRKNWPPELAWLGAPFLSVVSAFKRKAKARHAVLRLGLVDLGPAADALFEAKAGRGDCLLAERDAKTQGWSYARPEETDILFVAAPDGSYLGQLSLMRDDAPAIGLKRRKVIDLMVLNDDASVVDSLLAEALRICRNEGDHVLEVVGLPMALRSRFLKLGAMERAFISWPAYVKVLTPGIDLSAESLWHLTGYDGDATLV